MQAFIQVSLSSNAFYSFQQPIIQWLNQKAPEIATLDIDAASDEMLVNHAGGLMQEAELYAVYFKVIEPNANLGKAFRVVEEIIRDNKPGFIIVAGTHTRLTNIIEARPQLTLMSLQNEIDIQQQLTNYFNLV